MKEKKDNRYFGFEDVLVRYYKIAVKPKNKNKNKNEEFKNKFEKRHTCHTCHTPLTYVGGNIMVCKNPSCNSHSYELLDSQGKQIAESIYNGR